MDENIRLHLREKMCRYSLDWKLDGSHSKFNLDAVVAEQKKSLQPTHLFYYF